MRNRDSVVVEDIWINTSAGHDADRPTRPATRPTDRPATRPTDRPTDHGRRVQPRPAPSQRPGHAHPAVPEATTDWNKLEQENALLNPDPAIPDRG